MKDKNGNRRCDHCGRYVKEDIVYEGDARIPPDARFDETFCDWCQVPVNDLYDAELEAMSDTERGDWGCR